MANKKESYTISFRVDAHRLAQLEKESIKHGISIHERARRILIDALDDKATEEILDQLSQIKEETRKIAEARKEIASLRSDMAEAMDWIVTKLSSK
jgi:hypothetical protein